VTRRTKPRCIAVLRTRNKSARRSRSRDYERELRADERHLAGAFQRGGRQRGLR